MLILRPGIQPSSVFTHEFTSDTPGLFGKTMSVKQVEGLEYSIMPKEDAILSEPSPDWGIMIYFTEDHQDHLYFYESRSPGGIDPFVYGSADLNKDQINGKEMEWGIFGARVIGSCRLSDSCGMIFDVGETFWNENKKLIFDLMESAQIDISDKAS